MPLNMWVALCGMALGAVFGFTVRRSDFCMMGAVADLVLNGDTSRMRAWLLAMAVAMLGAQSLHAGGTLDLASSFYLSGELPWAGIVVGGLLFGFGMVLACGCPSRSVVNAACGDLRAFVTLIVIGFAAGMTMRGIAGPPRVWLNELTSIDLVEAGLGSSQGLVEWIGLATDIHAPWLRLLIAGLIAAALVAYCFSDTKFRSERKLWIAGIVLGALVTGGWIVTGVLGFDEFEPIALTSLTFVRPVSDGMLYLMTFTGASVTFGIAAVGGAGLGALVAGAMRGNLRFKGFEDLYEMSRYLSGGAMMGFGGVLALGCTVGQGISGISTLSVGSVLALASIVVGGIIGARFLEQGSLGGAIRAMFAGR